MIGSLPPSGRMNTPVSSRTRVACLLAMFQPWSITRLASPRPMPHSRCMHLTWRVSRPGASMRTVNMSGVLPEVRVLARADFAFQRLLDAVAAVQLLQVLRRVRGDDVRGHEDHQLGAVAAEPVGAEQAAEDRDVAEDRELVHRLGGLVVEQAGDDDGLPGEHVD